MSRDTFHAAAGIGLIVLILMAVFGFNALLRYGCNHLWGPWIAGTTDPVAVAITCKAR